MTREQFSVYSCLCLGHCLGELIKPWVSAWRQLPGSHPHAQAVLWTSDIWSCIQRLTRLLDFSPLSCSFPRLDHLSDWTLHSSSCSEKKSWIILHSFLYVTPHDQSVSKSGCLTFKICPQTISHCSQDHLTAVASWYTPCSCSENTKQ